MSLPTTIKNDLGHGPASLNPWSNLNPAPDPNSYLNWGSSQNYASGDPYNINYWDTSTPVYAPAEKPVFQSLGGRDSLIAKKVDDVIDYLSGVDFSSGALSSVEREAFYRRSLAASGFLSGNTGDVKNASLISDVNVVVGDLMCVSSETNKVFIQTDSNGTDIVALVNGYQLVLSQTQDSAYRIGVSLPTPPNLPTTTRQDMVFLEVWRERIDLVVPKFFYYGNTQYGGGVLSDDSSPTLIAASDYPYVIGTVNGTYDSTHPSVVGTVYLDKTTGHLIQIRYRIRVFSLDFVVTSVNPLSAHNVLTSSGLWAFGQKGSNSTSHFLSTFGDYGLFTASGDANLGVGGLAWCVPICLVQRRNSGAFSLDNINGGSGRPDLLTASGIVDRDVMDMRHTVTLGNFDLGEVYERTMYKLMSGSLGTYWHEQYVNPTGSSSTQLDIYGNKQVEGLGIRAASFSGTNQIRRKINTNNGISASPDGMRMVWSDAEEIQSCVCYIPNGSNDDIFPYGFFKYTSTSHIIEIDVRNLAAWVSGDINRVQFTGQTPMFTWANNGAPVAISWDQLVGNVLTGTIQQFGGGYASQGWNDGHTTDAMTGEAFIKFSRGSSFLDRTPVWKGAKNIYLTSDGTPLMEPFGYNIYEPLGFDEQIRKVNTFAFISDKIYNGIDFLHINSQSIPFGCCMKDSDDYYKFWVSIVGSFYLYKSTDINNFSVSPVVCSGIANGVSVVSISIVKDSPSSYKAFVVDRSTITLVRYSSTDGVVWTSPSPCNLYYPSRVSVIYDTTVSKFKIWYVDITYNSLWYSESSDGITWDSPINTQLSNSSAPINPDYIDDVCVIKETKGGVSLYKIWLQATDAPDVMRDGFSDLVPANTIRYKKIFYGVSNNGKYWTISSVPRWQAENNYLTYQDAVYPETLTFFNVFKDSKVYRTFAAKSFKILSSNPARNITFSKVVLGMIDRSGVGTSQNGTYSGRGAMDHAIRYDDSIGSLPDDSFILFAEYAPRVHAGRILFAGGSSSTEEDYKVVHVPESPVLVSTFGSGYKNMQVIPARGAVNVLDQLNGVGGLVGGLVDYLMHSFMARAVVPFDGRAFSVSNDIVNQYSLGSAFQFVRAISCSSYKVRDALQQFFYSGNFIKGLCTNLAIYPEFIVKIKDVSDVYANIHAVSDYIRSEAVDFDTFFPINFGDKVFVSVFSVARTSSGCLAISFSFGSENPANSSFSSDAFASMMVPCGRHLLKSR